MQSQDAVALHVSKICGSGNMPGGGEGRARLAGIERGISNFSRQRLTFWQFALGLFTRLALSRLALFIGAVIVAKLQRKREREGALSAFFALLYFTFRSLRAAQNREIVSITRENFSRFDRTTNKSPENFANYKILARVGE